MAWVKATLMRWSIMGTFEPLSCIITMLIMSSAGSIQALVQAAPPQPNSPTEAMACRSLIRPSGFLLRY